MREIEIDNLKEQLTSQPPNKALSHAHTSMSVHSTMSRMEREAEALKSRIQLITSEKEELKENLKEVIDDAHNAQISYTSQVLKLTDQIKKLENDIRLLRESQLTGTSNESKVLRMTAKIDEMNQQLEESNLENRKLKASYNQIK